MQPRPFYIFRQIYHLNITIQFNHIGFQFSQETGSVSPTYPTLSFVVNQYGRVNIVPPATCPVRCHGITYQRFAYRILKRSCRRIAYRNSDCFPYVWLTTLYGSIIIKLAVFFHDLRCPSLPYSPTEISRLQYRTMVCPCLHIFCRIAKPFRNIEFLSTGCRVLTFIKFIMTNIQIKRPIMNHRCRVGCKLIRNQRISHVLKCRKDILFLLRGAICK